MTTANYSSENKKFCLELDRVKLLLQKAGNPDKKLSIIHVAGTNGKGSVCAFIEAGLIAQGIRCGRFSSPELFSGEDTICVDGECIGKRAFANIINFLTPLCDEVTNELGKPPSPFEILFVAALLHFKKKRCKKVILECGMGGIGDATNAIETSDLIVLTNIDLDHADYLGKTVAEITKNKCGIMRYGKKVFSAVQKSEAEAVIVEECKKNKCELGFVNECKILSMDFLNVVTDIGYGKLRLSLAGVHQARNAALAVKVMRAVEIDEKHIIYALTHAVNRARLEEIAPSAYFDGAHNPAGVRSLVRSINAAEIGGKLAFVVGFMADKDISACLDELKKLNNKNFEIYTYPVLTNPRSETAEAIKELALKKGYEAKSFSNISKAVASAGRKSDTVFAFGSLYAYKELIRKDGSLI